MIVMINYLPTNQYSLHQIKYSLMRQSLHSTNFITWNVQNKNQKLNLSMRVLEQHTGLEIQTLQKSEVQDLK